MFRTLSHIHVVSLLMTFLSIVGCTRAQHETAQMTVQYGSQNRAAGVSAPPLLAVLNVSGPGINGIVSLNWQNPCMNDMVNCDPFAYNPVFQVEVTKGESRLIQVLVITPDMSTDGSDSKRMVFNYGDVVASLQKDQVAVDVPITSIGADVESSQFTGRILGPNGEAVTGHLAQFFGVVKDKPKMLIMSSEIFSGWVDHVVVLKGASFDLVYKEDGSKLATNLNMDDGMLAGGLLNPGENLMAIKAPAYYKYWGGNSQGWRRAAETNLVGIVGGGDPSQRRVCFLDGMVTMSHLFQDSTYTVPVDWMGSDASDPSAIYVSAGGYPSTTEANMGADCSNPNQQIPFKTMNFENDASYAVGVVGPFSVPSVGGQNSNGFVAVDGANDVVYWAYAPGVTEGKNPISGVTLFSYVPAGGMMSEGEAPFRRHGMDDGYDCQGLMDNKYGGVSNLGDFGLDTTSYSVPPDVAGNLTNTYFVLCPYRTSGLLSLGREYFMKGVQSYGMGGNDNGSGCPGPNCGPVADTLLIGNITQAEISSLQFYGNPNTCVPVLLRGRSSVNNSPASIPNDAVFDIEIGNPSASVAAVYTQADCGGQSLVGTCSQPTCNIFGAPLNNYFEGSWIFYLKVSGGLSNGSITVSASSPNMLPISKTVSMNIPYRSGNANKVSVITPGSLVAHSCVPVTVQTSYYDNSDPNNITDFMLEPQSGMGISFASAASANLEFYNSWDEVCTGATVNYISFNTVGSQLSLSNSTNTGYSNNTIIPLRMKYVGGSATTSFTPANSGSPAFNFFSGLNNLPISQPGAVVQLTMLGNNYFPVGSCQRVVLAARDSNFNLSPFSSSQSISISDTLGGSVHLQPDCSDSTTMPRTLTIAAGSSSLVFYYRNMIETNQGPSGQGQLTLSLPLGATFTADPWHYFMDMPIADHFALFQPGEVVTFNSDESLIVTGSVGSLGIGTTNAMKLVAVTPFGKRDPNFQFTNMNLNFSSFTGTDGGNTYVFLTGTISNPVSFLNGVADFDFTPNSGASSAPNINYRIWFEINIMGMNLKSPDTNITIINI